MAPLRYQKKEEEQPNNIYEDIIPAEDLKPALIHKILLNRTLRLVIVLVIFAVIVPCIIYGLFLSGNLFERRHTEERIGTCAHANIYHIICGHENITEQACVNRGCCFSISTKECYHTLPSRHQYRTINGGWEPSKVLYPLRELTPFGTKSLLELKLTISEISNDRVKFEFWDPKSKYQPIVMPNVTDPTYNYKIFETIMIEVYRKKGNEMLLTTARGPLIASSNYFEISIHLGTNFLFGLGEMELRTGEKRLLLNTGNTSVIPYIMAYNNVTNTFHGLVFSAPGPVEVEIFESSTIGIRSIFGQNFNFEVLLGPTLQDLKEQLNINRTISMPPYWGYGVHVCRKSLDFNVIEAEKELNELLNVHNIPFDSHCFLDNLIWLTQQPILSDTILNNLILLKSKNKRFLASVMPQILKDSTAYNLTQTQTILMKHRNSDIPYTGLVTNQSVYYIDWLTNHNLPEWIDQHWPSEVDLSADGLFLQNNWMSDETQNISRSPETKYFSYTPEDLEERLQSLVPWHVITTTNLTHSSLIQTYNSICIAQTNLIQQKIPTGNFFVTSNLALNQSTPVILQNFNGTWTNLRAHVSYLLGASLTGINFLGSSVCGDQDNERLNEELCIRWYQLASLTPLFRVRSDRTPNHFSATAMNIMNSAIRQRYSLLSYYNSIILNGTPLITPMFFQYPHLLMNSSDLTDQFNIGDSLLAAPILMPSNSHKEIYFPEVHYELNGGRIMPKGLINWPVVQTDIPLFIKKGHIIPIHSTTENTFTADEARLKPFTLLIALECFSTTICNGTGIFMITNNFHLTFKANTKQIEGTIHFESPKDMDIMCGENLNAIKITNQITSVQIYGLSSDLRHYKESRVNINICDYMTNEKSFIITF